MGGVGLVHFLSDSFLFPSQKKKIERVLGEDRYGYVWMDYEREVEVPEYFLCPISLQVMKDPVTTVTGITYERRSIEQWVSKSKGGAASCPVTKQLLPRGSDLTPNHTLGRLIQAWLSETSSKKGGIGRVVKGPVSENDREQIVGVVRELEMKGPCMVMLKKLEDLANKGEANRICMVEVGAADFIVKFIVKSFKGSRTAGLAEALRILRSIWAPNERIKLLVRDNHDLIDALNWTLRFDYNHVNNYVEVKGNSISVMKRVIAVANTSLLERLKPGILVSVIKILKDKRLICQQGIVKCALQILTGACPWGRNQASIVEAGAVFNLVELELRKPEKRVTEMTFNLLALLCSCSGGREQLLRHAGGIAMLAKRTLRVSPAVDEKAVQVLAQIAKFSGSKEVVLEMLRVGAVSKLCMVLQANCEDPLKSKVRTILRMHSNVWNNSPCIAEYLLTLHPDR